MKPGPTRPFLYVWKRESTSAAYVKDRMVAWWRYVWGGGREERPSLRTLQHGGEGERGLHLSVTCVASSSLRGYGPPRLGCSECIVRIANDIIGSIMVRGSDTRVCRLASQSTSSLTIYTLFAHLGQAPVLEIGDASSGSSRSRHDDVIDALRYPVTFSPLCLAAACDGDRFIKRAMDRVNRRQSAREMQASYIKHVPHPPYHGPPPPPLIICSSASLIYEKRTLVMSRQLGSLYAEA